MKFIGSIVIYRLEFESFHEIPSDEFRSRKKLKKKKIRFCMYSMNFGVAPFLCALLKQS